MTDYSPYTDEQLLDLLKASDEAAFTELYYRYSKLLFSIAANKTGSLPDAEEIVQEVYTDLWKRREQITVSRSLKSYLAAAVKFQVYSLLARKDREQQGKTNVSPDPVVSTPEQELDFKLLQIRLHEGITALPEKCRLIYQLKEAGLTNNEIAGQLDISVKTVESQVTTAFRRLRTGINSFFSLFF